MDEKSSTPQPYNDRPIAEAQQVGSSREEFQSWTILIHQPQRMRVTCTGDGRSTILTFGQQHTANLRWNVPSVASAPGLAMRQDTNGDREKEKRENEAGMSFRWYCPDQVLTVILRTRFTLQ
jgi:hypothetical protein